MKFNIEKPAGRNLPVFFRKIFWPAKIKHNKNRKKIFRKGDFADGKKLSVEELEELREKEFDERAERDERIQNTISLFRKIACVLAVMIAAAFIFFTCGRITIIMPEAIVTAEVINVEVLQ